MKRVIFSGKPGKAMLHILTVFALIGVFIFAPVAANNVAAAPLTVPVNMIYYGWHDATVDNNIISAQPEYLVSNSPAGPWRGNASISKFTSAGIKYFEYIDGGYEGAVAQAIPNDLQSNLNYINAAAAAGAYGVFLDEVSSYPSAASLYYLKQIADRAHSLGLKVVFNIGVDSWSDSLMDYADFINSSEIWNNAPLTASQSKWASRTWLLTQNVTSATTAAYLTNAAISKGIDAHYASTTYGALPTWLGTYVAQIIQPSVAPAIATGTATGITVNGATLNGTLSSMGSSSSVSVSFDWGLTTSYGNTTAASSMANIGASSAAITNLASNTTYHFRVKAVGSSTVYGSDNTFQTATATSVPASGNTAGTVIGTPVATGGASEYSFNLMITSTTVAGLTAGQQVWVAATTTDFPNLLTSGATLTGDLDKSLGWWIFKSTGTTSPPVVDLAPIAPVTGNTAGTVVGTPVATGGASEYSFNLMITSTTVAGLTAGQHVWVAATTTDFPNLLTSGATLTGDLDKSLGWWIMKK
ncbi:MAG: hypothetical protein Q8Q07_03805 [Dehalococcoidales bacterium]|nr:hypothetical protein [Dehalococcoidales bacterium]